ncbi:MAG: glycosyltransferase family 2 protein [Chloroflexi bacterium]|nr:glycosyltransferase family 2 protein [Chloroflexota bacterium]
MADNPTAQPPNHPILSIIIVSWNVRDLLRACLRSVVRSQESGDGRRETEDGRQETEDRRQKTEDRRQGTGDKRQEAEDHDQPTPVPCSLIPDPCPLIPEIIVVDNASADGSVEMVAAEFPWVRLIANAENRGFTGGNNQGLAVSAGRYVFFLNPDTVVVGDALATMVAYLDTHPEVGALGPQLRYGDGSLQSSCRRFPTFATALFESTPLAWHWPNNPWARRYRMENLTPSTPPSLRGKGDGGIGGDGGTGVDWLVGAALMVRREALAQVGGFDEGYFMYSEELDLCRRIKQAGWRIVYLPAAQIIHYEGKSSEQLVAARHIRFQTSKVRYFRKFHGPLAAEVLRVFILGLFAVEWPIEAVKWLLGSQRPLRRERMAAYEQLLRTRLGSGD